MSSRRKTKTKVGFTPKKPNDSILSDISSKDWHDEEFETEINRVSTQFKASLQNIGFKIKALRVKNENKYKREIEKEELEKFTIEEQLNKVKERLTEIIQERDVLVSQIEETNNLFDVERKEYSEQIKVLDKKIFDLEQISEENNHQHSLFQTTNQKMLNDYQDEIKDLRNQLKKIEEKLSKETEKTKSSITYYETIISEKTSEITNIIELKEKYHKDVKQLEKVVNETQQTLTNVHETNKEENDKLKTQLSNITHDLNTLQTQYRELHKQYDELENQHKDSNTEYQEQIQELNQSITTERAKVAEEMTNSLAQLTTENQKLRSLYEKEVTDHHNTSVIYEDEFQKAVLDIRTVTEEEIIAERHMLESALFSKEEELMKLKEQMESIKSKNEKLMEDLSKLKEDYKMTTSKLNDKIEEDSQLKTKCVILEENFSTFQIETDLEMQKKKEEIKSLTSSLDELVQLTDNTKAKDEEIQVLTNELTLLKDQHQEITDKYNNLLSEHNSFSSEYKTLSQKYSSLHETKEKEITQLQNDIESLQEKFQEISSNYDTILSEHSDCQSQQQTLSQQVSSLQNDNLNLIHKEEDAQNKYVAIQTSYTTSQASHLELIQQYEIIEKEFQEFQPKYIEMESQYHTLLSQSNNDKSKIQSLSMDLDTTKQQYQQLKEDYEVINNEFSEVKIFQDQYNNISSNMEQITQQNQELSSQIEQQKQEYTSKIEEITNQNIEYKNSIAIIPQLEQEKDNYLQKLLNAEQNLNNLKIEKTQFLDEISLLQKNFSILSEKYEMSEIERKIHQDALVVKLGAVQEEYHKLSQNNLLLEEKYQELQKAHQEELDTTIELKQKSEIMMIESTQFNETINLKDQQIDEITNKYNDDLETIKNDYETKFQILEQQKKEIIDRLIQERDDNVSYLAEQLELEIDDLNKSVEISDEDTDDRIHEYIKKIATLEATIHSLEQDKDLIKNQLAKYQGNTAYDEKSLTLKIKNELSKQYLDDINTLNQEKRKSEKQLLQEKHQNSLLNTEKGHHLEKINNLENKIQDLEQSLANISQNIDINTSNEQHTSIFKLQHDEQHFKQTNFFEVDMTSDHKESSPSLSPIPSQFHSEIPISPILSSEPISHSHSNRSRHKEVKQTVRRSIATPKKRKNDVEPTPPPKKPARSSVHPMSVKTVKTKSKQTPKPTPKSTPKPIAKTVKTPKAGKRKLISTPKTQPITSKHVSRSKQAKTTTKEETSPQPHFEHDIPLSTPRHIHHRPRHVWTSPFASESSHLLRTKPGVCDRIGCGKLAFSARGGTNLGLHPVPVYVPQDPKELTPHAHTLQTLEKIQREAHLDDKEKQEKVEKAEKKLIKQLN